MTVTQAIQLLADRAASLGASANDDNGAVRRLVLDHGLGFYAWFCVCCELADRSAKAEGFEDQFDRAAFRMRNNLHMDVTCGHCRAVGQIGQPCGRCGRQL